MVAPVVTLVQMALNLPCFTSSKPVFWVSAIVTFRDSVLEPVVKPPTLKFKAPFASVWPVAEVPSPAVTLVVLLPNVQSLPGVLSQWAPGFP